MATLTGDRSGGATTLPPPGANGPGALEAELEGAARALHVLWVEYERVVATGIDERDDLASPGFAREALRLRALVEGLTAAVLAAADVLDDLDADPGDEASAHLAQLLVPTVRGFLASRAPLALALGARLAPPISGEATTTSADLHLAYGPARAPRVGGALGDPPGRATELFVESALRQARGAGLRAFRDSLAETATRVRLAGVPDAWANRVEVACDHLVELGARLTLSVLDGDDDRLWIHGPDAVEAAGVLVVAWRWLAVAALAWPVVEGIPGRDEADRAFAAGVVRAADYWLGWELPGMGVLTAAAGRPDRPWVGLPPGSFG